MSRSTFATVRAEIVLFGAILAGAAAVPVLRWMLPEYMGGSRWHVGIEMWSSVNGLAQLYIDTGMGYNEPQSVLLPVDGGTANRLVFEIRNPVLRHVRFDPLMTGGVVRITRFWYEDAAGRQRRDLPLAAFHPANQVSSISRSSTGITVIMPQGASDPQLQAELGRPLVAPGPGPPWGCLCILAAGAGLLAFGLPGWNKTSGAPGAWISVVGVTLASLALVWPLHRTLDYPIWDEANSLAGGRAFWSHFGLGSLSDSPVYLLWYAGWTRLFPGGNAIYAGRYALDVLFPLVVLLLARRWFTSWLASAFVALGVALSLWQIATPYYVYDAALVLFIAGLAVADRSRIAALGFILLAALTRLEYGFAVGTTLVLWLLADCLGSPEGDEGGPQRLGFVKRAIPWIPLLAAGWVALRVESWESGIGRGWFAFEQHYAVGLAASGRAPGINPWIEYPPLIRRDFPGAGSLKDAFRLNPTAVLGHVGRNLGNAPGLVARFFVTSHENTLGGCCGIGLVVSAMILSALFGTRSDRGVRNWIRARRWSLLMALGGIVTVLPGLVVYSETAYLLPILPMVWALAALIAAWIRSGLVLRLGEQKYLPIACLAIFGGSVVAQTAPRPFDVPDARLPVRRTVEDLRRLCPDRTRLLGVAASTYVDYIGAGWVAIEPFASVGGRQHGSAEGNVDRLIALTHPNAILVNSQWEGLASFDRAGIEALPGQGWTKIPVPDGTLYLRGSTQVPTALHPNPN